MDVVMPAVTKKMIQLNSPFEMTPRRCDRFRTAMPSSSETSGTKMATQNCQDG